MKAKIYRNIDLVRIAVKNGVANYILPQNVAWADEVIDKIIVCAPGAACVDPVDGVTPVMGASDVKDLYFGLYNSENVELVHDLSWENFSHKNNHVLEIHDRLNLSLCRLSFTTVPTSDYTLLLYVVYGGREAEDYDFPKNSVTIDFPLQANEVLSFRDIMSTYIHDIPSRVRGIMAWDAENNPAYLTLRDYKLTYNLREAHTELMRPDMNGGSSEASQAMVLWLDNLDIDFDYSHIRNAENQANKQRLTFIY